MVDARWVLGSLALGMLLPSLGTSIANVALPSLVEAFAASFQQVQWVVLGYLLAATTMVVGAGRLGDLIGRRRLLMAGILLFTTASGLCGLASDLWTLVAARTAQGLGAAVMMALTMAFVGDAVPKERTGTAMGLLGSTSAVGTALGPSLGGVLIANLGWPAIFFISVPFGVLALVLAQRLPVDRPSATIGLASFDTRGTLLLALTLAAYALAMTIGRGRVGPVNLALLAAAALGVGLFVLAERRAASPLISLTRFRDPVLRASLATSALVSTVIMATLMVGPFYLARALGLDPARVGVVMSIGPVIAALAGMPSGRLVDHVGASRGIVAGLAGMLAGCAAMSAAPVATGLPGYVIPLVIITAGYALFQASNNAAVMTGVAADQRGVVSGLLNLSRNLGLITGAAVMGAVFAAASGAGDVATASAADASTGLRVTFAVAAGLAVAALAIAVAYAGMPRPAARARS
jgi:EmrB/QacA subfamily drug resistance transporter